MSDPRTFTPEQILAIERREGELLLDAGAGSGKTSVLVERFAAAVLEDGIEVSAILAITFTDKAAAELRDRIRARLRELGADAAARETERASISTIHGFCARVLRAHSLTAGVDPRFVILDEADAERIADAAFDEALEDLARNAPGAIELIASYGPAALRAATASVYGELRSRGEPEPRLPPLPPPEHPLEQLRVELERAAASVAAELGAIERPSTRVVKALARLERCGELISAEDPWPGDLDQLALPGGNGAALSTPACADYAAVLAAFRRGCEELRGERTRDLLDELLAGFGRRYAHRKRQASAVDFDDLEAATYELLRGSAELRDRYRQRFSHVMVDEFQDTNAVQLALIELLGDNNLFTVGDAQQSIYGFRHADVQLFEARGARLEAEAGRLTLATNFRSRPEILSVLNDAFAEAIGDRFRPLVAGRSVQAAEDPRVELLIVDKGAEWESDGLAAPWRLAEARALARRLTQLIDSGVRPGQIVVLTRATTDLRAYERALEDLGIPTYVIGGRGYWAHPQVLDVVGYLRALANPREQEALYGTLASPLVGLSMDGLVLLAAAARASDRDPWWLIREPEGRLDELEPDDRARLEKFARWFTAERALVSRAAIEELIDRALEHTGYDLEILATAGGERRLANVRKLMRLAREHEAASGPDLRRFLDLIRMREGGRGQSARESEAPVEGEALDAVRMMTIHRAKGLEFETVCVADLGRGPRHFAELVRVGRDGRLGLRLAEPGTSRREPALAYTSLGEEQQRLEAEEERRLFYVAMTRARERLILSGAAASENISAGSTPMSWIGPAMLQAGVSPVWVQPEADQQAPVVEAQEPDPRPATQALAPRSPLPRPVTDPPVSTLSYSSLQEYRRCGYRFYAERVLGLPAPSGDARVVRSSAGRFGGAERGIVVHSLLEGLDFARPRVPTPEEIIRAAPSVPSVAESEELAWMIDGFARSELCARLGRCADVRREERFAFVIAGDVLLTGALDVLGYEAVGEPLVVDYKSDSLGGMSPEQLVEGSYATQRLVYALAALRAGARRVEIAHVFLERPEQPVFARFQASDAERLEGELQGLAGGLLERRFAVAEVPHRALCSGCPAEGGLCSWPLELTRREAPDRLF